MSVRAISWAMGQSCPNPTTKLVLIILCNYADEADSCYPSEKHLAKVCGISDRHVRRSLTSLIDSGLIICEHRKGTSNRYVMGVDAGVHRGVDAGVRRVRTHTSANTKETLKNRRSLNDLAG